MAGSYGVNNLLRYIQTLVNNGSICLRGLSASINNMGIVTVTIDIVGRAEEVQNTLEGGLPKYTAIKKMTQENAVTSVLLTDTSQCLTDLRLKETALFKSVSKDTLTLYNSGIIPQDIVPANALPQATVFIKECEDVYETNGWTVREIINRLDLDVQFPNFMNYHITQLTAQAGTPIISLIQSLFPYPGISLKNIDGTIVVSTTEGNSNLSDLCITSNAVDIRPFRIDFTGEKGELHFLRTDSGNFTHASTHSESKTVTTEKMKYLKNKLGGIFGVTLVTIEQDQAQLPTELWELISSTDTK